MPFVAFDADHDYRNYVDGRARSDGVTAFLTSRGITLPRGRPNDPPTAETVYGLGSRKNEAFVSHLRDHGVEAFESTLTFVRSLRDRGIRTAVVSASENCQAVLQAAGADGLFEVRVDGLDAARLGLAGKPDPALFLEATRRLGVDPAAAAVVEDAIVGVQAGRSGGFGLVVGVDRTGNPDALTAAGADVVVEDLAELVDDRGHWHRAVVVRSSTALRSALDDEVITRLTRTPVALFFDYDGTLTPIVARPEHAVLSPAMSAVLERLARRSVVGVISGRDLADVRAFVPTEGIWLAGSHGFDLQTPDGVREEIPEGREHVAALAAAADELEPLVAQLTGAWVERKRFAIAVHHRQVDDRLVPDVEAAVDRVLGHTPGLRKTGGKRIFELRPDVAWDKGRALELVLARAAGQPRVDCSPSTSATISPTRTGSSRSADAGSASSWSPTNVQRRPRIVSPRPIRSSSSSTLIADRLEDTAP